MPGPLAPRACVDAHETIALSDGWMVARAAPDTHPTPATIDDLEWLPARVPGTVAGALRDAGRRRPGEPGDFDADDWWFRTEFEAKPVPLATTAKPAARTAPGDPATWAEPIAPTERIVLCLDGVATIAEVWLNGELVLESDSMFLAHEIELGARLQERNELAIRCLALAPLLAVKRRPRARWRTRLVDGGLRFHRTMLLGRAPGFAPGPAAVGPWRGVRLEHRGLVDVRALTLTPRVHGEGGVLSVSARLDCLGGASAPSRAALELSGHGLSAQVDLPLGRACASDTGDRHANRELSAGAHEIVVEGELTVERVARWWPHTHGEPALYEARLLIDVGEQRVVVEAGRVGFRELAGGPGESHDVEREGLALQVNRVSVFARGAVWTPCDFAGMAPSEDELRERLTRVRDAGMNMLRIPGTAAYESRAFHDLCDELGLMVWQDMMFANLDYPLADEALRASIERECEQALRALAGRPSTTVVCGNSEVEQQVAMLGLDPALGRGELFGELLPRLAREHGLDAIYVPSSPCGGELPFRPDAGIANYYGVGGYRRPLSDARLAGVRFAGECLAFSNVPDEQAVDELAQLTGGEIACRHPLWKAGVPRDAGSGWDFEDVRDHYLRELFGVDANEMRRCDHERYLELSRAVSGEAMAAVLCEWRRAASPCGGGMVLWLSDLAPGAGWGVLDHRGRPKVAYHHLRRALAPVAVWCSDEGLGGVLAHVANDRPAPLHAELRVALYRDMEDLVEQASAAVELPAHTTMQRGVEELIGRFVDASWAYRFGPPGHDAIVVSLYEASNVGAAPSDGGAASREQAGGALLSQAFHFPVERPLRPEPAARLGLTGTFTGVSRDEREGKPRDEADGADEVELLVRSRRLAHGVRIHAPGFQASDDAFSVAPGGERRVRLRREQPAATLAGAGLSALNLRGRVPIEAAERGADPACLPLEAIG